jgi:O-antigen/teichoic acid export membrane protein
VSISSALAGQGVYALVWGTLASASFTAVAFLGIGLRKWRPGMQFRTDDLTGYISFGVYQIGERVANFAGSRIDQLLIGSILGTQALGYYSFAFNLAMLPYTKLNPVLNRVAFPLLARIQEDDNRLKNAFMMMQQVLAAANFPILFGLAAIAPVIVPLAFGDKWIPAVGLIQILSFVAAMRSIGSPTGSLLLAKGRADKAFYWTILYFVTQIPALYTGAQLAGSLGIAATLLIMQIMYYYLNYAMNIKSLVGPCLQQQVGSVTPAGLTAGLMALAVIGVAQLVELDAWMLLITQLAIGGLLYTALNWWLFRKQTVEVIRLVLGKDT